VGGAGGAGGTSVELGRFSRGGLGGGGGGGSTGRLVGVRLGVVATGVTGVLVLVGVSVGPVGEGDGVSVGPVGEGDGVSVGPVGEGTGVPPPPTTRTITLPELALPALAELLILVPAATPVRTRTWIVTEAGLSARSVRLQLTVWPVVQLPEPELALSTSRFESTPSLIDTCWSVALSVITETL